MQNRKTNKSFLSLCVSLVAMLLSVAMLVPLGVAWLADTKSNDASFRASVQGSYFERGDGTQANPFIVARPIQMYYLAWLQDLGFFNAESSEGSGTVKQYYFKLDHRNDDDSPNPEKTLDMQDFVIPPIGTAQYPFVGNFDGNGYIISNLTVDNSNLTDPPLMDNENDVNNGAQIVGVFGVIGTTGNVANQVSTDGETYTYSSAANEVKDFVIHGATVTTSDPQSDKSLIGVVAGYVNGTVSGVGVSSSTVSVGTGIAKLDDYGNVSDYSVVGYCTDDCLYKLNISKVIVTVPTQTNNVLYKRSQGEGAEWGGSIDMKSMHSRLQEILALTKSNNNPVPRTYVNAETVVIDEVNGTRTVTPTGTANYNTVSDNDISGNGTVRYYYSEDSGSYVFSDYTNNSASYDLLLGKSLGWFPKTVTTLTKKKQYENGYLISDGTNYLNLNNDAISNGTNSDTATGWVLNNGRLYTYTDTGDQYFINGTDGALSASTTATTTTWAWDSTSENYYYTENGTRYYLIYSNGWTVARAIRITGGGYSLNVTGGNGTTATLGTTGTATTWLLDSNGYLSAVYNGTTYYLRNNNGTLTATSSTNNRTVWTLNNSSLGTENYGLCYNNGWRLSARTLLGHTISSGSSYLNITGTGNTSFGTGASRADTNDNGHTVWQFSNNNDVNNPSGTISAEINNTAYYLYVYRSGSMFNRTYSLRLSSGNESYRTWTNNNGAIYLNYGGNRYIRYNNSWSLNTTSATLTITPVYSTLTGASTVSDSAPSSTTTRTSNQVQVITREVTTMAGGHDTYFPLTAVGGTGDDKWDANTMNTGYIVSGSHASYQQASGDVRVSSAYTFNRGDLTNSVNGNTYYSNRLEVLTRTYKLNGFKRISDSKNGSNNSVSSTLSGIEKVSVNSLGLLKYEAARTQLDTMLLGNASSSTGPIYGMHFMDGVISMENMITAPKVTINGETYTNYQMPEDSIDFKLKTAGYINFFAGTYYMNSGKENNCFFSLNHIFRDENTHEITAIKRISKIYGNPSSKSSEYVYEYEDENGNISYSGSTAGLTMMFDTDWIERPDNFKGYSMYYFEIPVNAGEYALGSVAKQGNESARYGAYLCYLDIGTSGSTEDKDRVTIAERITTENANVAFPKGVQLVEDGGSFNAELPYETATVKLANGYTGDYLLSRTGNVFHYLAQTNASLNYLGGSLTAQQTTGEGDSATTITYHLENGYEVKTIENITDTGKDTGVVDYLRVETVDQFDSSGTRTSRTVTVYADPNLSNNTMDTLEEAASFTYTCADYDGIVVRCVRSASQSGFNVMFSENVTITSVTLQGDYYFNFGDNLKATLDTVNESGTGMSLAIAAVEMSERPASEKEYLYNPSTVGDDLATYYYYYDDEATVTPETTYTLTLGDTIATQTVSDYTITLTSSSGSVTVYATQLIASYEGTVSTLNSTVTPTATTPISVTVTVTPNVKINTTTLAEIGTVQKIEISGS